MADYKLQIKDGGGNPQELYTDSGSNGLVPYHKISGSVNANVTFPATQSVSLVNTGSLTASLSATDMTTLTASISAISSAVGLFNQQLFQALSGGPVSMSVDIVAGDVNTLTQSIGYVKDEVAKLTALSSSVGKGLLIYASESNPLPISGTIAVTGSVTTSANYATNTGISVFSYTELTASSNNYSGNYKGYVISNHTNHYLYLLITSYPTEVVTTSSFTYAIDPYSTYESMAIAAKLKHSMILHPSVSSGIVTRTILE